MSNQIYKSIDSTNTDLVLVKNKDDKGDCGGHLCYYWNKLQCPRYKSGAPGCLPCTRRVFGKTIFFHFKEAF